MAHDEPRPLSWSLGRIASRVRRVDLVGFGAVQAAWDHVGAASASEALPVRLADGELVVSVPSGAHAARARRDSEAMLSELAILMSDPPSSLRVTVRR